MSRSVQLDVVELLKQVLQWTPLYKPGLNKALLQAAKVGSIGCIKVCLLIALAVFIFMVCKLNTERF